MNFRSLIHDTHSQACRSVAKQEELKLPLKPELCHQYGMLFNHNGYMMPGLQSLQLFLAIDLPKIADLQHTLPPFPKCTTWAAPFPPGMKAYETMGSAYVAWTVYHELNQSLAFLDEAVHHKVCIQYKTKYDNLLKHIDTLKQNIAYKNSDGDAALITK